jgi:FtsP/CotA-like multicopper oxidase with cupredoxin domain
MLVAALPRLGPRALASDTVDYTLNAAPLTISASPAAQFSGLAFNGTVPGPVIRIVHGQRLRANLVNHSGRPATIHWHGMILPNDMDGTQNVTQPAVAAGESFLYDFIPGPTGTRWYHDHLSDGISRGLFGLIIVEEPSDERADVEYALVFHDLPNLATFEAAMRGVSKAPMVDPAGSPELLAMKPDDKMGDEVAYIAHCINGASYPNTKPLPVRVGQRVRLRILNANLTQTRYIRLAGHRLTVTHADGNRLEQPFDVDALRVGVAERYDAWFEVTKPGAWLLQGLASDPLEYQQAVVVYTEGMQNAPPAASPQSLVGVDYFTYEKAGGAAGHSFTAPPGAREFTFTLGGGEYASDRWTINGKKYPNTPKIYVTRNEQVVVRFKNTTDMDHPMHLHGHVFQLVEVDGTALARPLPKDTALVRSNHGTATWQFAATSPAGRWLLHCHNEVHMMDGMMTEVVYRA